MFHEWYESVFKNQCGLSYVENADRGSMRASDNVIRLITLQKEVPTGEVSEMSRRGAPNGPSSRSSAARNRGLAGNPVAAREEIRVHAWCSPSSAIKSDTYVSP